MEQPEQPQREIQALRERLSLLSQASLRINESLDFDRVLQGALDSARSLTGARHGVMTLLDLVLPNFDDVPQAGDQKQELICEDSLTIQQLPQDCSIRWHPTGCARRSGPGPACSTSDP